MKLLKISKPVFIKIYCGIERKPLFTLTLLLLFGGIFVLWDYITLSKFFILSSDAYVQSIPMLWHISKRIFSYCIPTWSFYAGLGQNIYPQFMSDPFQMATTLFGKENVIYLQGYVQLAKILLAGVFFYLYLRIKGREAYTSIIFSLLYAFSYHLIMRGMWYAYGSETVMAAFLLYAYERFNKQNNYVLLPIACALIALPKGSYYLYIYTLFIFAYAALGYIIENGLKFKTLIVHILKLAVLYAAGIMLSAAIWIPDLLNILGNPRVTETASLLERIFSPGGPTVNPFITIITSFFGFYSVNSVWQTALTTSGGQLLDTPIYYCGLISILLVPQSILLSKGIKKTVNVILLTCLVVYMIFPYPRYLLSGYMVPYYKTTILWTTIVLIYLASEALNKLDNGISINKASIKNTFFIWVIISLVAVYILSHTGLQNVKLNNGFILAALVLMGIYTFLLLKMTSKGSQECKSHVKPINMLLLVFVFIETIMVSSLQFGNAQEQYGMGERLAYFDDSNKALEYVKEIDKGLYRMEKEQFSVGLCDALIQEYNGTKSYQQYNNPSQVEFLEELEVPFYKNTHAIQGFGDRFRLNTLVGLKYYIAQSDDVPYGYEKINTIEGLKVLKSKYFLPLGFTYDKYVDRKAFDELIKGNKDKVLLKAVVLEDEGGIPQYKDIGYLDVQNNVETEVSLPLTSYNTANIIVLSDSFPASIDYEALNNDPMLWISPMINKDVEVTINMEVESDQDTTGEIYWNCMRETLDGSKMQAYSINKGNTSYEFNIQDNSIENIRIDAGGAQGVYKIKNLSVKYRYLESDNIEYVSAVEKLNEEPLVIDNWDHDYIKGHITVSEDKFLFFSIPYDKGWHIKLNGKPVELVKANIGFMGTYLKKGSYNVELSYMPPYLTTGIMISFMGLLLYIIIIIYSIRQKKVSTKVS